MTLTNTFGPETSSLLAHPTSLNEKAVGVAAAPRSLEAASCVERTASAHAAVDDPHDPELLPFSSTLRKQQEPATATVAVAATVPEQSTADCTEKHAESSDSSHSKVFEQQGENEDSRANGVPIR